MDERDYINAKSDDDQIWEIQTQDDAGRWENSCTSNGKPVTFKSKESCEYVLTGLSMDKLRIAKVDV